MYKKINTIIICIFMIFVVLGCSITKPPSELINKPKNLIEGIEIDNIVSQFLSDKETLTLAIRQNDKESVRRVNLDEDEEKELLLLYKGDKNSFADKNEYGVIILKKNKDKWHEINRISQNVDGLDLVEYKDLTGDKKPDLLIGWNMGENQDKILSLYSWHNGYFHSIYESRYRELSIDDLNNDGQNELVLLERLPKSDATSIEVLRYSKEEMISIDKFNINNKSYYSTMTVGNASLDKKGIFIDFDMDIFSSYTDLLIMKNNKLVEVLGNETIDIPKTSHEYMIKSKDINNDGIIEFGLLEKITEVKNSSKYNIPLINTWYKWDGKNDITLVLKEYYNHDKGYKVQIPKEWGEEFTIIKKFDEKGFENKVEFYTLDSNRNLHEFIFSIQSFSKEEWEENKYLLQDKRYVVLEENEKSVIVGGISDLQKESKYFMNEDRLKGIFSTLK
ncbi:hypothetical protein [Clostridium ganghwense]|uniref:VCBS repeat-containing protein n=1 Tax=Clostridium ganghwense TaxID=312089 RepID=A0ABT4CSB2_9CLOT|nr:hypothetical protein [Clostridium ganghwense]MCY6371308.1 hypothetical protein [Clostridium ganghwense]